MVSTFSPLFIYSVLAVLGLCLGSFLTMLTYRLPRGEDIIIKPSHCTFCGQRLKLTDLIPVVSWLCLKGKCRYCHTSFGWRYVFIECITAGIFIVPYSLSGWQVQTIFLAFFGVLVLTIIIIDLDHKIIPDSLQMTLLLFGIAYILMIDRPLFNAFLYCIILGLGSYLLRAIFFIWKKKEALGLGDVKFFALSGFFLDIQTLPVFLFLSGTLGVFLGLVWQYIKNEKQFPFAPALVIALYVCLILPRSFQIAI